METNTSKKRKQAGRLLAAGARCDAIIQSGEEQCYVSIPWENNREIPYLQAIDIGYNLNREALKEAIALASEQENALKACNYYIGELGRILDIPYFRDRSFTELDNNERTADLIYNFLLKAVNNPRSSGLRKVASSEAQDLANKGYFAVGSAHSIPGVRKFGHIALVAPDFLPKDLNPGNNGPWIRDAHLDAPNHAKMSVRTSKCFRYSETLENEEPIFVIWEGQDWLITYPEGKICVDLDGDGICDDLPDVPTPPTPPTPTPPTPPTPTPPTPTPPTPTPTPPPVVPA